MYYNNIYSMDTLNNMDTEEEFTTKQNVHIRIQARTSKKFITIVEGLGKELNIKKICMYLKKNFNCNGAVSLDKEKKNIIKLQGDHRESTKQFLMDMNICVENQLIIHGY
jgi:translation initiation factor SUI1